MAHDLIVWGVGTSRTLRPHWMLLELGLDYECHPIQSRTGETVTDEFKRLNPRHKIPVLRHRALVLTESAAILQYLSETFANPAEVYLPSDAVGRARLHEWCYFTMSELDAGSLYVVRRHDGLQQIYGAAPTAVAHMMKSHPPLGWPNSPQRKSSRWHRFRLHPRPSDDDDLVPHQKSHHINGHDLRH
jgi:glutathione S-transferase